MNLWITLILILGTALSLPRALAAASAETDPTARIHAAKPVMASSTSTLYDGTSALSNSVGFSLFNFFGGTQSFSAPTTTFDTTSANSVQAGYNSRAAAMADLNAAAGFRLNITARLNSEDHASINRAGFSIILLDNNKHGVELGFWEGEIWAQNDGSSGTTLFTHGEGAAFNTTLFTSYELEMIDGIYRLSADGSPILSGPMRDYTAFTGTIDPYENSNYIFLGDDTGSANASVSISAVTLTTATCDDHNATAPTLSAEIDNASAILTWTDLPENFSYTAVRSTMPYSTFNSATTLGSSAGMTLTDPDILLSTDQAYYQLKEDTCGSAEANEIGIFQYTITKDEG